METISRRSFIGKGALAGAALAGLGLVGCAPQAANTQQSAAPSGSIPETWDAEADVIVLGAGGTGLSAACAAAKAGATVIVYDEDSKAGGTTEIGRAHV